MNINLFERIQLRTEITNVSVTFENITVEFIKNYCYCVIKFISIENEISYEEVLDKAKYGSFDITNVNNRTKILLEWLSSKGENYFYEVIDRLEVKKLSDKASSFARLYNHILQKAIDVNDKEMLLDNLYYLPGEMLREYTQFGFLKNINNDIEMLTSQILDANNSKIKCKINGGSAKQISCFA